MRKLQSSVSAIVVAGIAAMGVAGVTASAHAQVLYDLNFDSSNSSTTLIQDQSGSGNDFDNITEESTPLDFVYAPSDLLGNPSDQVLDVDATGNGGTSQNIQIFDEDDISDAGGFAFELYVRRTENTPGQSQNIWNPAGTHSLEITSNGELQLAIRGVGASLFDQDVALPLNEWRHVAGVFTVENPIDPNAGPFDPLSIAPDGTYQLYIDGVLIDPDNAANPDDFTQGNLCAGGFIGSCLKTADEVPGDDAATREQRQKHGLGATNFGTPNFHFRGQIAMTRLSLGAVEVNDFNIFRIPGDFDLDGDVDLDDFNVLAANFGVTEDAVIGQRVTFRTGDADGDGDVDLDDFNILAANFGSVQSEAVSALPEPGTVAIVLLAACAHTRLGYRRSRQ